MVAIKLLRVETPTNNFIDLAIAPGPLALRIALNEISGTTAFEERHALCSLENNQQRTDAVCEGMCPVLEQHAHSPELLEKLTTQMKEQFHQYLDSAESERVWVKRVKYLLAYPLARYLRNDLPPVPDVAFVPTGLLRKWMRNRLHAFNEGNSHLWSSWLQVKRSALPLSMDYVNDAYNDHKNLLTKAEENLDLRDRTIQAIFKNKVFDTVLEEISDHLVGKCVELLDGEKTMMFAPSSSACFSHPRSEGGAYQALIDRTSYVIGFSNSELVSMDYYPRCYGRKRLKHNVVLSRYVPSGQEDWNDLLEIGWNNHRLPATIQAVLEPLKCRVISKGDALSYYRMKPLQRVLHTYMRQMPCFAMIGQPFSCLSLIDVKENTIPAEGNEWISVDYSAATDNLSWAYSEKIIKRLICKLPSRYQELALRVLGPHDLYYPRSTYRKSSCPDLGAQFEGTQQRGQLMGSILSFPILCLANLGLYLAVTGRDTFDADFNPLKAVLINGDDMIYMAKKDKWNRHVQWGRFVGLEMSQGKAYHHSHYANLNSTSVHFQAFGDSIHPKTIDYFPSGLFLDRHKVQENIEGSSGDTILQDFSYKRGVKVFGPNGVAHSISIQIEKFKEKSEFKPKDQSKIFEEKLERSESVLADDWIKKLLNKVAPNTNNFEYQGSVVSNINLIMSGTLARSRIKILDAYLKRHKEAIDKERTIPMIYKKKRFLYKRPLFSPISLGGFGVKPPVGWNVNFSKFDYIVAGAFIRDSSAPLAPYPLPGPELRKFLPESVMPWLKPPTYEEIKGKRFDQCFRPIRALLNGPELHRYSDQDRFLSLGPYQTLDYFSSLAKEKSLVQLREENFVKGEISHENFLRYPYTLSFFEIEGPTTYVRLTRRSADVLL